MESDRDNDGGGDGVRELFIVDLSDGNNVTESLRLNFLRPYKTLAHFVLIFFSKMAWRKLILSYDAIPIFLAKSLFFF